MSKNFKISGDLEHFDLFLLLNITLISLYFSTSRLPFILCFEYCSLHYRTVNRSMLAVFFSSCCQSNITLHHYRSGVLCSITHVVFCTALIGLQLSRACVRTVSSVSFGALSVALIFFPQATICHSTREGQILFIITI